MMGGRREEMASHGQRPELGKHDRRNSNYIKRLN